MRERYQLVARRLATQDLRDAAADYVAEVDTATAHRFIDAADQALTLLARQPGIGSPATPSNSTDQDGAQSIPRFPELILNLEHTGHLDALGFFTPTAQP